MGLNLLYGPAGFGKSTKVQETIISLAKENPKKQYVLIVPDQFTMQTQMDIVLKHPNGGIMNIDVLSFSRLSYRVFSETGRPRFPVLDDTGKSLVLRKVAGEVAKEMPYIGANLNKIGYLHEVKSAISEFMQYGVSLKDLESLVGQCDNGLLKTKLNDLCVIYDAFMRYNKDKFVTSEETLDILCEKIPDADFLRDAYVVFDGFTGFTPIQERVILKLMEVCENVTVTLTLSNPETYDMTGAEEQLFYLSRRTGERLKKIADDNKIEVKASVIEKGKTGRFVDNKEFLHLEKSLFRYPIVKYDDEVKNMHVLSCPDIETEIQEVTLRIHELVRSGKYAYRDIAVVVGDLGSYADSMEARMKELNIPCFIDCTKGIVLNPFIEYLKSALSILIKDYSYDAVFHYLKSGFTGFENDEIDRFDRYVSSLNLRGAATYHKEFKKRQKGMPKAVAGPLLSGNEALRVRLIESLEVLEREAFTAGDYVRNLYDFLKANDSCDKLKAYEDMFNEKNDLSKAREYGQIYRLVMELLETIMELIGDEKMSLEEFYRIFEAGIAEIEVGTIPKNVDRVVVGDIERTRLKEIKALFFMGVNDGNIPKVSNKTGILSDAEKEKIRNVDLKYELAPTERLEMYTQRLYLYMNLCKPTEALYISYSNSDREGKGLRPSYLVSSILKLYPKLRVENIDNAETLERIVNLRDSYSFYSKLLRKFAEDNIADSEKTLVESLHKLYMDDEDELYTQIENSAFTEYLATPLAREIVKLVYGASLESSISRMEMYAGCAYAHFLKYGMDLKEKAEYDFKANDLGAIYHGVLDMFSSKLEARGLTWASFSEEEGITLVTESVREYCEDYEQGILKDDEQTAYVISKITRIMIRTVKTLQFHVKSGKFVPRMHEYAFVRELNLEEGSMMLKGRIDRIDLYEDNGRVFVKIVDYKSSGHDIDITNVYYGLEQQLSVYMNEAIKHEKEVNPGKIVLPSALLYYKIDNPMISIEGELTDEAIEQAIKKELKVSGVIENSDDNISNLDENAAGEALVLPISFTKNGMSKSSAKHLATTDEMINMLDYTERMMTNIGNRILDGDITTSPMKMDKRDACKYCSYKAICRFDEKIPGFKARGKKTIDEETARENVMGGNQNGLYLFD